MEEKNEGKRLAETPNEKKKQKNRVPLVVTGVIFAMLLVGYLGLCIATGGEKMWPNTTVMGIDVSGLTMAQAQEKLTREIPQQWEGQMVELVEPTGGHRLTLSAENLMEPADLEQDLRELSGKGGFLTRGGRYLANLLSRGDEGSGCALQYTQEGQRQVDEILSRLSRDLGIDGNETTYEVTDTHLVFHKGVTGTKVDADAVRSGITDALVGVGPDTVTVPLIQAPPAEPNFASIKNSLYAKVADAYLDRESQEIVPSVTGKDLDVEAARIALTQTAEGKVCRVPLKVTEPEMTTQELTESLFRDVLGAAATHVTGTSVRKGNVKTAAAFLNDTILLPGDEFSFNEICSPYTVANGYGKATAYVNGLSKDTVAGGICQASSTLYWATLKSNLETVERSAHRYEPSYIRGGLDATVYGDYGEEGSLDFRFKNNTAYPLKIEAYMDNQSYLHVIVHGTDKTGVHGEPYSTNRVVTKVAQTIYQADASVPAGTTRKDPERTAYNGVSIETYQRLVDAQGKEVSTTLLYKTRYYARDAVIYFNPDDLELWGIDPVTGIRAETADQPVEGVVDPNEAGVPTESGDPIPENTPAGQIPEDNEPPVLPPQSQTEPTPPPVTTPEPTATAIPPGTIVME